MPLDPPGDQSFRTTDPKVREREMTYAGALSFCRRRYGRDLAGIDVAVTGLPFDGAVTNRPGARLGPRAIRAASTQLAELLAFPFGFDPFERLAVVDYGDAFLDPGEPLTIAEALRRHVAGIVDAGTFCLGLGGDHFVTYPCLQAHAARFGPLALVQFDAHSDTWTDVGQRLDHGTMFTRAVAEGLILPERSVQIGIRTVNPDDLGITVLDAPWVHRHGVDAVLARVREVTGAHPVYLTFDVDCLDPAFAPGTGTPVVGGLSTAQTLAILRELNGRQIVGADVVEVAPAYDVAEITALAAATVAHDLIALLARDR
ncbi:MAG: agmatinase [Geminicoccaceae bacterium]|nr:MAG: agmatinase [Geminicoccaceae bacterium]